jgi:hypothetical protein
MSYEGVDVYVRDQNEASVEGVIVRIYNTTGSVLFTQATTDADGHAGFLLATQQYSMRFYKAHTTFQQPQLFTVLEAPEVNAFNVAAETFTPPVSNDARLSRCSGFFHNPDGSPQRYLDLHFYPDFSPIVVDGIGVIPRKVITRTDEDGYVEIDLYRGAKYRVSVEGMESEDRFIRVPDQASTNLPDLLYPVVDHIIFDPEGPYSLNVGDELELTPVVYDSAGATLPGTGQADVEWRSSNMDVLGISVTETVVRLRGVAVGSAELRAARKDLSIIRIPDVPVEGQPLPVTVL